MESERYKRKGLGIKIPLIEAYNSMMHFDLLGLSETFLDTSVEKEKLFIQGFSREIWRSDHPRDTKQGGCLPLF